MKKLTQSQLTQSAVAPYIDIRTDVAPHQRGLDIGLEDDSAGAIHGSAHRVLLPTRHLYDELVVHEVEKLKHACVDTVSVVLRKIECD